MRTIDARAIRRLDGFDLAPTIPVPVDVLDCVQSLQPLLARVRRREWSVLITGPRTAADRDAAAVLQARLLDLADALEAR